MKLIVGVDGSPGSATAVSCCRRPPVARGERARVVIAVDLRLTTATAAYGVPGGTPLPCPLAPDAGAWATAAARAAEELRVAGPRISTATPRTTRSTPPLAEAESWGADCIFLGAKGQSRVERFLLGSVSSAVAQRAACSVEVVRFGQSR